MKFMLQGPNLYNQAHYKHLTVESLLSIAWMAYGCVEEMLYSFIL